MGCGSSTTAAAQRDTEVGLPSVSVVEPLPLSSEPDNEPSDTKTRLHLQGHDTPYISEYAPRPTGNGALVWICGGTGSGKTALTEHLKGGGDFVCYEGDCFLFHLNPYTDVAPNGAGGGTALRPERLSGIPSARILACKRALDEGFMKITQGGEVDFQVWEDFYRELCADVLRERKVLGHGWNFAIAQAVYTRRARDLIRNILGPELVFVVLEIDSDLQAERICRRFGMPLSMQPDMQKYCHGFEPTESDEPRTLRLRVKAGLTQPSMAAQVRSFLAEMGFSAQD